MTEIKTFIYNWLMNECVENKCIDEIETKMMFLKIMRKKVETTSLLRHSLLTNGIVAEHITVYRRLVWRFLLCILFARRHCVCEDGWLTHCYGRACMANIQKYTQRQTQRTPYVLYSYVSGQWHVECMVLCVSQYTTYAIGTLVCVIVFVVVDICYTLRWRYTSCANVYSRHYYTVNCC